MLVTTRFNGATAVISPCGEIDFGALPTLLATARMLPPSVTQVIWDMRKTLFMDAAGLRLLAHQRLACRGAGQTLTVTGLARQPLRMLRLARELFPADRWGDFLHEGRQETAAWQ